MARGNKRFRNGIDTKQLQNQMKPRPKMFFEKGLQSKIEDFRKMEMKVPTVEYEYKGGAQRFGMLQDLPNKLETWELSTDGSYTLGGKAEKPRTDFYIPSKYFPPQFGFEYIHLTFGMRGITATVFCHMLGSKPERFDVILSRTEVPGELNKEERFRLLRIVGRDVKRRIAERSKW